MNLDGSVIIVTGSATGLGADVAKQCAAGGARVVINYTKSEAEALETQQAVVDAGSEAILCRADVSVDADCRRMATAAVERWGRIDGLVNNAGSSVFASSADLESLSGEQFLNIYGVNVVGAYQMARACKLPLQARGDGAIVNVSSMSSLTGAGSSIAYATSKGALNTLTLSLARALAPEVRVNAVLPGALPTRWWTGGLGEERAKALFDSFAAQVPLKAVTKPEKVAEAIVWLLSGADFVTGELLKVDSGMHLLGFQP